MPHTPATRKTTFANFMLGHLVLPRSSPPRQRNIGGAVLSRPPAGEPKFANVDAATLSRTRSAACLFRSTQDVAVEYGEPSPVHLRPPYERRTGLVREPWVVA